MIPLAKPVIGDAEKKAVLRVLNSGQLSLGPTLKEFESGFSDFVGAPYATAVSSGTAGLHLALRGVGVEAGSEVITSPFSFIASSNSVLYQDATPVFVDVDPVTLNIGSEAVKAAVTDNTSALLPVHIFGVPAPISQMQQIGLPIVEDACEALGAVHPDGTVVGNSGNPAVFAFYANKQLATGEGGMITCSDPLLRDVFESERNQGRAPDMQWLEHDRLGYNYRLSELGCALGVAQLQKLQAMLQARDVAAERYGHLLSPLVESRGLTLPAYDFDFEGSEIEGAKRSWFVYVVMLPQGCDRANVIKELADRGIQTRDYLPAIHLFSFYREKFGFKDGQFPVAEAAAARGLALPFFPEITEAQQARVAGELADVLADVLRRA